jgi:hypothetical protein
VTSRAGQRPAWPNTPLGENPPMSVAAPTRDWQSCPKSGCGYRLHCWRAKSPFSLTKCRDEKAFAALTCSLRKSTIFSPRRQVDAGTKQPCNSLVLDSLRSQLCAAPRNRCPIALTSRDMSASSSRQSKVPSEDGIRLQCGALASDLVDAIDQLSPGAGRPHRQRKDASPPTLRILIRNFRFRYRTFCINI